MVAPLQRLPLLQFPPLLRAQRKLLQLSRPRPPRRLPYIKIQHPAKLAPAATVTLVALLAPLENAVLPTILARGISTCGQATAHYHGDTIGTTHHRDSLQQCNMSPPSGVPHPSTLPTGTQPSKPRPPAQEPTTSCRSTNPTIRVKRTWTSAPPSPPSTST